jgi:hypothetical protein
MLCQCTKIDGKLIIREQIVVFMLTEQSTVGANEAFFYKADQVCSFVVKKALLEVWLL